MMQDKKHSSRLTSSSHKSVQQNFDASSLTSLLFLSDPFSQIKQSLSHVVLLLQSQYKLYCQVQSANRARRGTNNLERLLTKEEQLPVGRIQWSRPGCRRAGIVGIMGQFKQQETRRKQD